MVPGSQRPSQDGRGDLPGVLLRQERRSDTAAEFEETVYDFDWAARGDLVRPRFSFQEPGVRKTLSSRRIYGARMARRTAPKQLRMSPPDPPARS